MANSSKQQLILDDLDIDLDVDLPNKRRKQGSGFCRTCYGIFIVFAVALAFFFTLMVLADLIGFAGEREQKGNRDYGSYMGYYILGNRESNEDNTITGQSSPFSPPPFQEKALTARYIVHNTDWGTVSTISKTLSGVPFGTPESFCDGPVDNSTGVPYFYLTPSNPTASDVQANPDASLTLTEAQTGYCGKKTWDPEDPQCARVCLSGKMSVLEKGSKEEQFAKNSLFARHPQMKDWPSSHDWLVLKLSITNVWMLDFYGPSTEVPVKDYFDAKP